MACEQPDASEFTFDLTVYRLSAIKKAAYRFAGDFQVTIEQTSEQTITVRLRPIVQTCRPRLNPQWFNREVLDQELREEVAAETKGIRDLLLAHAFSGLSLTDPQGEVADYRTDPLNILQTPRTGPTT